MAQIPTADLPVVDPKTGRINLEWYAALQRLVSELGALGSGGVTSFEGRTGVVVGVAGDYTAAEVTNSPAGNIAAVTVQAAIAELDAEKQPLDADLTALAALASTGLVARTAAATYAERTLTAPAAGITVSNGGGVAGNPTLVLANDLAALEAMAGTGIVARTAAETYAQRTITGTANEISVANGDGVAANPTLSLPATIDLGGKTSLEIPNSAAPTVDADGEIAVDTTVTDFSHGVLKYFGGEELGVVAMPIGQFTAPTDGYVPTYNAAADEFQLQAPSSPGSGFSSVVIQVLAATGTYTPTSGMDYCIIEAQGAGGGGGGADGVGAAGTAGIAAGVASGGGGGGEYRRGVFTAATIGGSQSVTINAAGTAGANTGAAGGNGGAAVVGALITANGGTGGAGTGSNSTSNTPVAGGAGGSGGSGGSFSLPGGDGGYGFVAQTNPSATGERMKVAGAGGASFLGRGGAQLATVGTTDSAGTTGGNYGGGGSGATDDDTTGSAGGAGGAGFVIVTEFIG